MTPDPMCATEEFLTFVSGATILRAGDGVLRSEGDGTFPRPRRHGSSPRPRGKTRVSDWYALTPGESKTLPEPMIRTTLPAGVGIRRSGSWT
jgi:hypothetical protein